MRFCDSCNTVLQKSSGDHWVCSTCNQKYKMEDQDRLLFLSIKKTSHMDLHLITAMYDPVGPMENIPCEKCKYKPIRYTMLGDTKTYTCQNCEHVF